MLLKYCNVQYRYIYSPIRLFAYETCKILCLALPDRSKQPVSNRSRLLPGQQLEAGQHIVR